MTLVLNSNQLSNLKKIGRGAEAEIYIDGNHVYKIFHLKTRQEKYQKIKYMTERKLKIENILFPEELILDNQNNFLGYTMKYCDNWGTLADLFNKSLYMIDTEKLIDIAINICEIYKTMHNLGIVIGDGNPKNFLLSKNGEKIYLADVDSIQLKKGFKCNVGVGRYLSPEIQRLLPNYCNKVSSLPDGTFSIENDRFVLSNLVFQTLMNGVHPFTQGKKSEYTSSYEVIAPEKCIYDKRSAFFNRNQGVLPKDVLDINSVFSPRLKELLRKGLLGEPQDRPSAGEIERELINYKKYLKPCNKNHMYLSTLHKCPYCELESIKNRISEAKRAGNARQNNIITTSSINSGSNVRTISPVSQRSNSTRITNYGNSKNNSNNQLATAIDGNCVFWGILSFMIIAFLEILLFNYGLLEPFGLITLIGGLIVNVILCVIGIQTGRMKAWGIPILLLLNAVGVIVIKLVIFLLIGLLGALASLIAAFIEGIGVLIFIIAIFIALANA